MRNFPGHFHSDFEREREILGRKHKAWVYYCQVVQPWNILDWKTLIVI